MIKLFLFCFLSFANLLFAQIVNLNPLSTSIETRKRIKAVEDSLSTNGGGTIYFLGTPSTIFHVDSTINLHGNVSLDGLATIKQDTGVAYSMFVIQNDSNITIKNLTLDGGSTGRKINNAIIVRLNSIIANILFDKVKFSNFKYNAVSLYGSGNDSLYKDYSHDITFNNCTFTCDGGVNYFALYFSGAENISIRDCIFYNIQWSGIEFSGGYNKYANVVNNHFYMGSNGIFAIEAMGVMEHASIYNNKSYCGVSGGGISIHARYSYIDKNHIIGGITGNNRSGLECSINSTTVFGNIIDNGTLVLQGDGEVSTTSAYNGTRRSYDTVFCNNNIIIANTIKNNNVGYPFLLEYNDTSFAPYDSISGNVIVNNTAISNTPNTTVYYLGGARSKITNMVFKNNIAISDSNKLISGTIGIRLYAPYGSHDIDISNNKIKGYQYGFYIDTAYYYNINLSFNDFIGTTTPIISLHSPSYLSDNNNYKTAFKLSSDLSNCTVNNVSSGSILSVDTNNILHESLLTLTNDSAATGLQSMTLTGWKPSLYLKGTYKPSIYLYFGPSNVFQQFYINGYIAMMTIGKVPMYWGTNSNYDLGLDTNSTKSFYPYTARALGLGKSTNAFLRSYVQRTYTDTISTLDNIPITLNNNCGLSTLGIGDSVQVTVTGITSNAVINVSWNLVGNATLIGTEGQLFINNVQTNKFSIHASSGNGKTVSWFIAKP